MVTLIVPVAGNSSRFPDLKPKWLLTHPNGNLMFYEAISGLDLSKVKTVVIACRKDHAKQYGLQELIKKQFQVAGLRCAYRVAVIPPTRSQPETVYETIRLLKIRGPIVVKDSDNHFRAPIRPGNQVMTINLNQLKRVEAANKSYVELDEEGRITNIVEKHVISNTFCVGGYGFAEAADFVRIYKSLAHQPDLYISHIIYRLLGEGAVFRNQAVTHHEDWGTLKDWNRYKRTYATLFVDLDGLLVRNSAQYFKPIWGTSPALRKNVEAVNRLADTGRVQIIITTSRSDSYRQTTEKQLKKLGVQYHQVLYGMLHARRILINDFTNSNPYRSAEAINLPRNSEELSPMLADMFELLNG